MAVSRSFASAPACARRRRDSSRARRADRGAAQQPVHRHPQRLAADVPQRLVDGRNRRAHHRSGAIEAVYVHRLPDVLHLHRVGADDEVAEVLDAGHVGAGLAFQRALAPTHQTLVGFEFDEYVRPVGRGRQRHAEHLHPGDFETGLQRLEAAAGRPAWAEGEGTAAGVRPFRRSRLRRRPSARPAPPNARKFLRSMVFLQRRFVHVDAQAGASRKLQKTIARRLQAGGNNRGAHLAVLRIVRHAARAG